MIQGLRKYKLLIKKQKENIKSIKSDKLKEKVNTKYLMKIINKR